MDFLTIRGALRHNLTNSGQNRPVATSTAEPPLPQNRRPVRLRDTIRLMLLACALFAGTAHAASLRISCSGVGQEAQFCKSAAEDWAAKTGNEVRILTPPNDASERLALYQQLLFAMSDKIDVLQIDVIWPGLLGRHLLDLGPHAKGAQRQHFAGFIANNTINRRLVAIPWFANAGLLFYRKDLLQRYGREEIGRAHV